MTERKMGPARRMVATLPLLGLVLALLALGLLVGEKAPLPIMLFVGALSLQLLVAAVLVHRRSVPRGLPFQIDEAAITRIDPEGSTRRIPWCEIARVRYVTVGGAELGFFRKCENAPFVSLPLSTGDAEVLLEALLRRTSHLVGDVPFATRVPRGRLWRGMLLMTTLFLPFFVVTAYWMVMDDWGNVVSSLIIPGSFLFIVFVFMTIVPVREIRFDGRSLTVSSLLRASQWSLSEIDAVRLHVDRVGWFFSLGLQIDLASGATHRVPWLGDDPIGCVHALERALAASRARPA